MAQGLATFEAGPVTVAGLARSSINGNTVVGLARSSINGQATDAHQWLVNVTLLRE